MASGASLEPDKKNMIYNINVGKKNTSEEQKYKTENISIQYKTENRKQSENTDGIFVIFMEKTSRNLFLRKLT
jgi:hypothetical protein